MKIKKALKKLDKAESLLSSIIDEYDTNGEHTLSEALATAKESVVRAKETVDHNLAEAKAVRKPAAKAAATSQGAAGQRGRRRIRAAATAQ
jgi:vacuolar-type H+-ATPase subunit H